MIILPKTIIFQITGWSSIHDMQNGKDYLKHYNEFLHILDFEKLF